MKYFLSFWGLAAFLFTTGFAHAANPNFGIEDLQLTSCFVDEDLVEQYDIYIDEEHSIEVGGERKYFMSRGGSFW